MGVGVHRHRDAAVAQSFLNYFRVEALLHHQCSVGISEIMHS